MLQRTDMFRLYLYFLKNNNAFVHKALRAGTVSSIFEACTLTYMKNMQWKFETHSYWKENVQSRLFCT